MSAVILATAAILLLTLVVGLGRVARGPTDPDRMLAVQLFGTTGVAVLLLLGHGPGAAAAVDVALVFALLAVIATVAFVRHLRRRFHD